MKSSLPKEVAARILTLKKSGEGWSEFAERVGLTPQVVSNYKTELNGASLDNAATVLAHVPRLSGAWLVNGRPPRYVPDESDAVRLEAIQRIAEGAVPPGQLHALATASAGGAQAASRAANAPRTKSKKTRTKGAT